MHQQLVSWLRRGKYPPQVASPLKILCGELGCMISWLAYDADRVDWAYDYAKQTVVYTSAINHPSLQVRALDSLGELLVGTERPRAALDVLAGRPR